MTLRQRLLPTALLLGLTLTAGCGDFSPWPPAGGEKEPTVHAREPRALPKGEAEGEAKSLLAASLEQPGIPTGEALDTLSLPRQSKALVFAVIQQAAKDDLDGLMDLMSVAAGFGLPATSELGSEPVADNPERFMNVLRSVGSRLSAQASFRCAPVMPPALEEYVRTGAEPMWCFFTSGDQLDLLAFKLRVEQGQAKVAYVGLFEERPSQPVMASSSEPPPPPVAPVDRTATNDDFTYKPYFASAMPGKGGKGGKKGPGKGGKKGTGKGGKKGTGKGGKKGPGKGGPGGKAPKAG